MAYVKGNSPIAGYPLGVILLDTQFPRPCGDVGNSMTFEFNVTHTFVANASPKRVVGGDKTLLDAFAAAAQDLQNMNVNVITTSCGFLALFQKQIAASLSIPFVSSSLMQIPLVAQMLGPDKRIGLLTANSDTLTAEHLACSGWVLEDYNVAIKGMQKYHNFVDAILNNNPFLDEEKIREEMLDAAATMVEEYPDIGAFVFECANMPPYAEAVQLQTGLPVFDIVTLNNFVCSCFIF